MLWSGDSRLSGGDEEIRTPGLVSAIHALSQLSYVPTLKFSDFLLFFLAQILAHPTAASQERQKPVSPAKSRQAQDQS